MNVESFRSTRDQVLSLYDKTDSDLRGYIVILREWMKKQLHLPSDSLQDEFLEVTLLKNKFSVEKSKTKIEFYCTLKSLPRYQYFLRDYLRVPSKEPSFYISIPKLTEDCQRILIGKIWDEESFDAKGDITNCIVLREFLSRYDYSVGEINIMDFSLCSSSIITKMRVNVLADSTSFLFRAYSERVSQFHLISKGAAAIFALIKPFLPSKMKSRVFIHDSSDNLKNILPIDCLPKDYGGLLKSLDEMRADMDELYTKHEKKLIEYMNTRSNEELREGGSYTEDMKGTFRKLNID